MSFMICLLDVVLIQKNYEPPSFCCLEGKVSLVESPVPDELYDLFTGYSIDTKEFCSRSRAYNSVFSFTSFQAKYDRDLASSKSGTYTFKTQGQVYHFLPPLKPGESGPCFFQLYFYDSQNEVRN